MPPRLAFVVFALMLAFVLCASSIWLVPAGQGPFSAVHGPSSPLWAQRIAARVFSCIRTLLVAALLQAAFAFFARGWLDVFAHPLPVFDPFARHCVFRC